MLLHPDEIQKALARLTGAEHQDMMRTDGYMTAWMLYQLCGDEEAASAFVGEGAELLPQSKLAGRGKEYVKVITA